MWAGALPAELLCLCSLDPEKKTHCSTLGRQVRGWEELSIREEHRVLGLGPV